MFLPDPDIRVYVQRALGYSLAAGNPEKKIFFAYGEGNSGKTTIFGAPIRALGAYGFSTKFGLFLEKRYGDEIERAAVNFVGKGSGQIDAKKYA